MNPSMIEAGGNRGATFALLHLQLKIPDCATLHPGYRTMPHYSGRRICLQPVRQALLDRILEQRGAAESAVRKFDNYRGKINIVKKKEVNVK